MANFCSSAVWFCWIIEHCLLYDFVWALFPLIFDAEIEACFVFAENDDSFEENRPKEDYLDDNNNSDAYDDVVNITQSNPQTDTVVKESAEQEEEISEEVFSQMNHEQKAAFLEKRLRMLSQEECEEMASAMGTSTW